MTSWRSLFEGMVARRSPHVSRLVLLAPERASLCQPGPAAGGLTQHCRTPSTHHDSLGVAEHGGDPVAAGAFDVHEVGVGMLHQTFQLVFSFFFRWLRMQKVLCKRHFSLLKCNFKRYSLVI